MRFVCDWRPVLREGVRPSRALSALSLALLLGACSGHRAPVATPAASPAPTPALTPAAQNAPVVPSAPIGSIQTVPVERIDSTQQVRVERGQRCGPRITRTLPAPSTFGRMASWVGLGGPSAHELPAPDFQTEIQCEDMAVRSYAPAQYRATYHVGNEAHSVDTDERPGLRIAVDEAGQAVRDTKAQALGAAQSDTR